MEEKMGRLKLVSESTRKKVISIALTTKMINNLKKKKRNVSKYIESLILSDLGVKK